MFRIFVLAAGLFFTSFAGADPADPSDAQNAATHYRKAFEVLPDTTHPDWAILEHPDAVRLDDVAVEFIRKQDPTFELLRKGAACRTCDWGIDLTRDPRSERPHLAPARTLANLTRLRTRLLVQQRRHAEAMDDVVALLTLSRHVGSDPSVAAKLSEAALAESAVAAAAPGVASLPPDVARTLMEKLERLPGSMPAAEVVRREGEQIVAEVRRTAADGAEAREVEALLREAAAHLALSFEQSFVPIQTWEKKRQAASAAAQKWVPSLRGYRVAAAAAETRVQMLFVAAAVRVDGQREVFRFEEPHAKGPFTYRDVRGGFEIESKLVVDNLPLRLTCKASSDEIPF